MRGGVASLVVLLAVASPTAADELHATYVTADEIRLDLVLPPPAPGSDAGRADLAAVEAAVRARTPADEARITAELPCSATAFAAGLLGPGFTAANVPLTAALVFRAFSDTELAVIAAKRHFARARPYTLDPALATFGHRSRSTAYPSGHAACGRVIAAILAAMVPGQADALYARGATYGRNRLIAGTHFPSDLTAGETAGSVVADALFRNPRFQADFARAAAETRAAVDAR